MANRISKWNYIIIPTGKKQKTKKELIYMPAFLLWTAAPQIFSLRSFLRTKYCVVERDFTTHLMNIAPYE